MRHKNSVFHDLLKRVPWAAFDRLVDMHLADKHVRQLSSKSQFVALLYGRLAGAVSLRDIVCGLESHSARLYHLGAAPAARSTLADANAKRSSVVFAGLFAQMVARAGRGLRRTIGEATYQACGAKMHVVYDADAERPIYAAVTAAKVNDITVAKAMPIEPGATYVFDLGYYDFGWWARLDKAGCRIVTRVKSHTKLTVTHEQPVGGDASILSDRIGLLPARQAASRKNPFSDPVREFTVRTLTGKVLRNPVQRSRRTGPGGRRSLQAPLGD